MSEPEPEIAEDDDLLPLSALNQLLYCERRCALIHVEGLDTTTLQAYLWDKHRIIVIPIVHAEFSGIRVTPNVYTTLEEIDAFCSAVEGALRKGI